MNNNEGGAATVITQDGEGHWAESLVGDNTERLEALKSFESPDDFFKSYDEVSNKDWRKEIAGDDDKFLSTLQRFNAPTDFGNSFREAQQTIRSGQLQKALGEDATAEDIQAYREAKGIPDAPEGYLEKLPDGLVLGEDDMPIASVFMEALHSVNAEPTVAHALISKYNEFAEQQQDAQAEMDSEQAALANDELRNEWGTDYRANMNAITNFMNATFGEEAREQLLSGRFADGRAFMNDPKVLQSFAALARQMNPANELYSGGAEPLQAMNEEIAELEKFMREHRTEYNNDVTKQERLRTLYDIRIKQG
jgi:hypothetical protein